MKRIILVFFVGFLLFAGSASAQLFNKFSLAVGPVFGWNVPSVTDLNEEMKKAGISEFNTSGFFATGGGGFIDVPVVKGLRVGFYGYGFSSEQNSPSINNSTKVGEFSYSMGALAIEYSKKFGESPFDWTLGGMLGIGSTNLKLVNYSDAFKQWNINYFTNDTNSSGYKSVSLSAGSYSVTPQIGIGYQAAKFLYFKLNAGYMLTMNSKWKIDDVVEVNNFPSGIKADGFMFNFGIYLGLFVD